MFCRRAAKKWPHSWTKMMEASTAIACAVEAGPSSWKPLPRRPAPPRARPAGNQSARGRGAGRGRGRRPPRARGRGDARGCRATRGRSRAHHARRATRGGARGRRERRGADARTRAARARGPAEIVLRVPRRVAAGVTRDPRDMPRGANAASPTPRGANVLDADIGRVFGRVSRRRAVAIARHRSFRRRVRGAQGRPCIRSAHVREMRL